MRKLLLFVLTLVPAASCLAGTLGGEVREASDHKRAVVNASVTAYGGQAQTDCLATFSAYSTNSGPPPYECLKKYLYAGTLSGLDGGFEFLNNPVGGYVVVSRDGDRWRYDPVWVPPDRRVNLPIYLQ